MGFPVQPELIPRRTPRLNVPAELLRLGYVLLSRIGEGATAEVWDAKHGPTGPRRGAQGQPGRRARGRRHLGPHADGLERRSGSAACPHRRDARWRASARRARLAGHGASGRGRTSRASSTRAGVLEPARAVHIARQVAAGLQVLHRRGVVHRDVKPENVFLCASGQFADHARLIDLGVLSVAADDPERAHDDTGQLIMGTPLYLAPEMAEGAPSGRPCRSLRPRRDALPPAVRAAPLRARRSDGGRPVAHARGRAAARVTPPGAARAPVHTGRGRVSKRTPSIGRRTRRRSSMRSRSCPMRSQRRGMPTSRCDRRPCRRFPGRVCPRIGGYLHTVLGRYVAMIWRDRPLPAGLRDALEWAEDARLAVDTAHGALELRRGTRRRPGPGADCGAESTRRAAARPRAGTRGGRGAVARRTAGHRGGAGRTHPFRRPLPDAARRPDRARSAGLRRVRRRPRLGASTSGARASGGPQRGGRGGSRRPGDSSARPSNTWPCCTPNPSRSKAPTRNSGCASRTRSGARNSWRTPRADATVTAQRAYENACLQLFTEYVEQAASRLRGTLPGV
jgi:hypothetical protein